MSINLEALERRGIYRLNARNLIMGVWTGNEWIGIRDKFGALFLDACEVPGDDTVQGTAYAIEKIGELPDGIEMQTNGSTVCANCLWEAAWIPDDPDKPVRGTWIHQQYNVKCDRVRPTAPMYRPLFDYLTEIGGTP